MPSEKSDCQAGLVTYPDGAKGVMIAGGNGAYQDTSAIFLNLDTLVWEPKQDLPVDLAWGASVPYQDSFLIVGGDSDLEDDYLDTIYYYNPSLDQWELMENMIMKRRILTAFMVPDSFANCS